MIPGGRNFIRVRIIPYEWRRGERRIAFYIKCDKCETYGVTLKRLGAAIDMGRWHYWAQHFREQNEKSRS